jgi:hypothetical protein
MVHALKTKVPNTRLDNHGNNAVAQRLVRSHRSPSWREFTRRPIDILGASNTEISSEAPFSPRLVCCISLFCSALLLEHLGDIVVTRLRLLDREPCGRGASFVERHEQAVAVELEPEAIELQESGEHSGPSMLSMDLLYASNPRDTNCDSSGSGATP